MQPEILAVCVLATWRLAALFYFDAGPWDGFERLRYRAGVYAEPRPFWGKLLGCFWCLTLWSGLLCGIAGFLWWPVLLPLALSGAAVLLSGGGRTIWRSMVE
ncbi:MAG: DUF1360 domain-containing protein [Planctomycetaceae bacterium]|nr:MAG: DUF1360 domain-containing protein [Planctomycetaceae bacterium]